MKTKKMGVVGWERSQGRLFFCSQQQQRTKKTMSNSPGRVDFATGLVIFVLKLPDGQVLFLGKMQITEGSY